MFAYAIKSLAQGLLVLVAVAALAFSMFRFVGDPVANMMGQEATLQDRAELTEKLGLNDPVPVQFFRFVGNAMRGEFGISYRQARKVSDLIAEKLPATIELAVLSAIFAVVVGIAFGVYAAIRRDGILANIIMSVSLVGVSLPTFLIGIGLIYIFAVELKWLPSFGRGETVKIGWWSTGLLTVSGWKSLIMPVLTLGFFQLTLIMRLVRAQMLETLRADYVRFARARGVSERTIQFRHALKNTMIPVI
ncbi:MAG: ABC transporter permease, partial [Beijerinckiaceae bacterium]